MLPSAPGGPNKGFSSRSRLGTCSDLGGDELSLLLELSLRPESDLLRFAEPEYKYFHSCHKFQIQQCFSSIIWDNTTSKSFVSKYWKIFRAVKMLKMRSMLPDEGVGRYEMSSSSDSSDRLIGSLSMLVLAKSFNFKAIFEFFLDW